MTDIALLRRELDQLEAVQAKLATVSARTDDRRRHDLIELRRELSSKIADVGRIADTLFDPAQDPERARTYRAMFSRMRSAAAMHQADWPAVRLGEAPDEYRKSVLGVREANRSFVAWMRQSLATDRRT